MMINLYEIDYLDHAYIRSLIETALDEDLGSEGDVTTFSIVPEPSMASAELVAKAEGTLAGLPFFEMVFEIMDGGFEFSFLKMDGDRVAAGDVVATIEGLARPMLIAERTALNLLCRLSGIATLTATYVEAIKGTNAVVLDTRKTTPGLRILEKYAVFCGGGVNHRIGLFDAILIKENHIAMGGGVRAAVRKALEASKLKVQVEVENIEQLREAIDAGAHSVLLDNMSPEQTAEAVVLARELAGSEFKLESSGGITIENIRQYAEAGVDRISTGALTHSARALDLSLEITPLS